LLFGGCSQKTKEKKTRNRRVWVHPMLSTRLTMGAFYTLFNDLREDDGKFFNYFRMSPRSFDELYELYSKLEDNLHEMDTNMRRCFLVAPDPDGTDFFSSSLEKELIIPFHLRWISIPESNYDC
jgi:hypothetical protein